MSESKHTPDDIRFAEFISFHRLDRVLGNLARESAEGRVGNTAIHLNNEAA